MVNRLKELIDKLKVSKFPELTYVAKNYTKQDLIEELEDILKEVVSND